MKISKQNSIITLFFLLLLLAMPLGCKPEPPYKDPGLPIETRVQDLLSRMTLEEKIEQMSGTADLLGLFASMLFHKPFTMPDNDRLGIPGLRFTDGPRGVIGWTSFPVAMARGATWDTALEKRVGTAMGLEAQDKGANVMGTPCINVLRHPGWGRAQETYGEDPFHIGGFGVSATLGVQNTTMAQAKHFALNSIEQPRLLIDINIEERALREIYLPHFKKCIEKGQLASIMSAYNQVNGRYCSENYHLLRNILKGDWHFDGFVASDWFFAVRSTIDSVKAGLDIEMPLPIFYGPSLLATVRDGLISEILIDEAVTRILRQKIRFGLLDPFEGQGHGPLKIEHPSLALETAQKSIVLLKNDDALLPLNKNQLTKIAVIGKFADQARLGDTLSSSANEPEDAVTPFQGIIDRAGEAITVLFDDGQDIDRAVAVAEQAEAVIIVGALTVTDEGENVFLIGLVGGDRHTLGLSKDQEAVIQAIAARHDNCIVVLEGGSAVTMESWADDVAGVLMAWYPGQEGGYAIADVIFGNVNPCGKLPLTWPKNQEQLPEFGSLKPAMEYDYYHGYRYFDKHGLEPQFPFGFGLSYTEYTYSNLVLDQSSISPDGKVTASIDVTNIGELTGEEVVQLYIGYQGSQVDRPVKELKGFGKLALDPGQTGTLAIEVAAKDLAYYDVSTQEWIIEEITYIVSAGSSSRDLYLHDTFQVTAH